LTNLIESREGAHYRFFLPVSTYATLQI